jgi:minor curlin subunit
MATHTTLKTLMASLVAVTIASTALTVPAEAGGSISFTVKPKNAKEEQLMKLGLGIYTIAKGFEGQDGIINQDGTNNLAGLAQLGTGNFGVVHQEGSGHNGTLAQNGNGNAYGLFQFGKNTDDHVVQNGNGDTGATFSFGW